MLIGVAGAAGSGKNAVADILCRERGFVEVAFADPMKRFVANLWGWSEDRLWGESKLRNEPDERYRMSDGSFLSARKALQLLGTDWGRLCDPNVWAENAIRTAGILRHGHWGYDRVRGLFETDSPDSVPVVIPDVRFLNEIKALRTAGGKVWRVVRGASGLKGEAGQHASEQELRSVTSDRFDLVIDNNGTLEDLRAKVLAEVDK